MKSKDLAVIAFIAVISLVISILVSNMLFGSPAKRQIQGEVVQPISSDFPEPDSAYFNSKAFDPTKLITIGQSTSTDPFSGSH